MVPLWFTLSALWFVGAVVLLYVDIDRRRGRSRRRRSWARSHGFDYERESTDILKRWKRGVISTVGDVPAHNVVLGQIRGEAVYIFDLEEVATVIALHRKVGTNVVVDLRIKGLKEPRENDIWLLGAIGPRIVYPHKRVRGGAGLRPANGRLRARRARLRRDHVERAELDVGRPADLQHACPMGRGPSHRAPVQRPAAGVAAGAPGNRGAGGTSPCVTQPPIGAGRSHGVATGARTGRCGRAAGLGCSGGPARP